MAAKAKTSVTGTFQVKPKVKRPGVKAKTKQSLLIPRIQRRIQDVMRERVWALFMEAII